MYIYIYILFPEWQVSLLTNSGLNFWLTKISKSFLKNDEEIKNSQEYISKRATDTDNYSWIHFQHVCIKEITNRWTTVAEIVTTGTPSCLKQGLRIQRKLFSLEAKRKKAKDRIFSSVVSEENGIFWPFPDQFTVDKRKERASASCSKN